MSSPGASDLAESPTKKVGTGTSIRSSSALLVGRILAMGLGLLVQALTVRYLTKGEYGAYAWSLSVVLLVQAVLPLGLDRANSRFLALYDEQRDYGRLLGFMAIEALVVLGLGGLVVGMTMLLSGALTSVAPSPEAVTLLVILMALAPLQAADQLVVQTFAVFGSTWSVFIRRYLVQPALRLLVVVAMVSLQRSTGFLAAGTVAVSALAEGLYIVLLWRTFKKTGLASHLRSAKPVFPWKDTARFCGPMALTGVVTVASTQLAGIVLGQSSGPEPVADFRAIQPFAALNVVVMMSFTTLFTPTLARLAARGADDEMRELHWRTSSWIAVLTFPILAVTTVFAPQLTVLSLGERYASSAPLMVILAVGYYVNACLGFNGITAQVLGRSRWVLVTTLVTLATTVVAVLVLAPLYGAVGAAVAVLITLVVHNVLKQCGLGFGLSIGVWDWSHAILLAGIVGTLFLLAVVGTAVTLSIWVALPLVFVAWLVLLRQSRRIVRFAEAFPEIRRIPVARWWLA